MESCLASRQAGRTTPRTLHPLFQYLDLSPKLHPGSASCYCAPREAAGDSGGKVGPYAQAEKLG